MGRHGEGSTATSRWHQDAHSPLARARHPYPDSLSVFTFPMTLLWLWGLRGYRQEAIFGRARNNTPLGVVVPEHVAAGTVMLVHFDMVHAGISNCSDSDRFMLKFVFNRMSNPSAPTWNNERSVWYGPETQSITALTDAWQFLLDAR